MLKPFHFAAILLLFCLTYSGLKAQLVSSAGITTKDISALYKMVTKQRVKSGRFVYLVYLKDSSRLKVNSNIFKDKVFGRHFVYYAGKDSLSQIFPDQTITLVKQNPFDNSAEDLIGIPSDSCWRFQVLKGRISAYSFLLNENRINEIQFENGSIVPFDPKALEILIADDEEAYNLFLQKNYYGAIRRFNE